MTWYNIVHGAEFWLAVAIMCVGALLNTVLWVILWIIDKRRGDDDDKQHK